jgi:protein-tyrosine phosphatase
MSGFVDLHAHYLADVDDGAPDWDTTVAMVEGVMALGFTDLYATPHQRSGLFLPALGVVASAFEALRQLPLARAAGTPPRFGLGAENFWDEILLQRIQSGTVPSYDDGPAFLFEVNPQMMPTGIEATLFELRLQGKLPVMAHPERYVAIQKQLGRAGTMGQTAALVVDLGAIDGAHGKLEMRTARGLLGAGLVHAVATDIHNPEDLPGIAAGIAWIEKHLGPRALTQLLSENPRRILTGELPDPVV